MRVTYVVTCTKCRAWYNMDMEEALESEHFDFHTGQPCVAGDDEWMIVEVPDRTDWYTAY